MEITISFGIRVIARSMWKGVANLERSGHGEPNGFDSAGNVATFMISG
jgi:hypothetical protein